MVKNTSPTIRAAAVAAGNINLSEWKPFSTNYLYEVGRYFLYVKKRDTDNFWKFSERKHENDLQLYFQ